MNSTDRSNIGEHLRTAATLVLALAASITVSAQEEADSKWWTPPELNLSVIVPRGDDIALQDDGGFALTLQMSAWEHKILGIGVQNYPPTLPGSRTPGWLVFDDPDGCPSFIELLTQAGAYAGYACYGSGTGDFPDCTAYDDWGTNLTWACPGDAPDYLSWLADVEENATPWAFDETWVEFYSGVSVPDQVPPEERETRPQVWMHTGECDTSDPPICTTELQITEVGPSLGSETDFTRYGRWARLPGLVVIADHGPGLITGTLDPADPPYDETDPPNPTYSHFFDPPQPLEAWNAAGLFTTVGHTLQADRNAWPGWGRTTLTAQLIAPSSLFRPVILIDRYVSIPFVDDLGQLCEEGSSAYRIDGGPLTCKTGMINWLDRYTNAELVTLRIFVVNGDAPDIVVDMDGNGRLDIRDVEAMGYEALTYERVVRFYQYSQAYCGVRYDFDGNHHAPECVMAARAGGITGVPR